MPDLLAHALLAYALCRVLSWRYDWLTSPYITVGMAGAFIPDLAKAELLIKSSLVERLLGVPFSWFGLHTSGGALVSILIGGLLVDARDRGRIVSLLAIGAASHLVADALLRTVTGRSYPIFWPLTRYAPPTPGLYVSTRPEPTIGAFIVALSVFLLTRYRNTKRADA